MPFCYPRGVLEGKEPSPALPFSEEAMKASVAVISWRLTLVVIMSKKNPDLPAPSPVLLLPAGYIVLL